MLSAMISYSRRDEAFVHAFYAQLLERNVDVWIDFKDIPKGVDFREAIYRAVVTRDAMIIFLSPNYLESDMCRLEAFLAEALGKTIIPLMIEDCWQELNTHEETRSIAGRIILSYQTQTLFGLPMTDAERFENIMAVLYEKTVPVGAHKAYIVNPIEQSNFAAHIADDLQAAGIQTWMGSRSFFVGEHIKRAWSSLHDAKVMIPILTHRIVSEQAYFITKQVLLGRMANLRLLPIIAPDYANDKVSLDDLRDKLQANSEMSILARINWFNPKPSYDEMLSDLIETINVI